MKFIENKLTLNLITKDTLMKIKGGTKSSSSYYVSDEDAIGNQMRPRTSGIGGLIRPKSYGG